MKVSVLIPTYKTWRWTAICIWHFKKFGLTVDSEIIVCDNAPDHPAIRAITDTHLGNGITVVSGNRDFHSHGNGYDIAARLATGDWFFTAETDSFPTREGWFEEYQKASEHWDLIGPEVPQSSGRYIHPAGALMNREIYEAALTWQEHNQDWWFVPGAGLRFGEDKPYHIVAHHDDERLNTKDPDVHLWRSAGPYQEMRNFDDDNWTDYHLRTGIGHFLHAHPVDKGTYYRKLGWEAGQWLAYFAEQYLNKRCLRIPAQLLWMDGKHGQQAQQSGMWDGSFVHCWGGTVSNLGPNAMAEDVKRFKLAQQDRYWQQLPARLRLQIEAMEKHYEPAQHR